VWVVPLHRTRLIGSPGSTPLRRGFFLGSCSSDIRFGWRLVPPTAAIIHAWENSEKPRPPVRGFFMSASPAVSGGFLFFTAV
jgi:hypothetical protein